MKHPEGGVGHEPGKRPRSVRREREERDEVQRNRPSATARPRASLRLLASSLA